MRLNPNRATVGAVNSAVSPKNGNSDSRKPMALLLKPSVFRNNTKIEPKSVNCPKIVLAELAKMLHGSLRIFSAVVGSRPTRAGAFTLASKDGFIPFRSWWRPGRARVLALFNHGRSCTNHTLPRRDQSSLLQGTPVPLREGGRGFRSAGRAFRFLSRRWLPRVRQCGQTRERRFQGRIQRAVVGIQRLVVFGLLPVGRHLASNGHAVRAGRGHLRPYARPHAGQQGGAKGGALGGVNRYQLHLQHVRQDLPPQPAARPAARDPHLPHARQPGLPHQLKAVAQRPHAEAAGSLSPVAGMQKTQGAAKVDFSEALKASLNQVNQVQQNAETLGKNFAMGDDSVSLSDVMIAGQKANISFQTTVQVRNKLVSAYHDIMNMQV